MKRPKITPCHLSLVALSLLTASCGERSGGGLPVIHVAGAVDGVAEDDNPVIVVAKLKK